MQAIPEESLSTMLFLTRNDMENISNGIQTHNKKLIDSAVCDYFSKIHDFKKLDIQIIKQPYLSLYYYDETNKKIFKNNACRPAVDCPYGKLWQQRQYVQTKKIEVQHMPKIQLYRNSTSTQ
jgi:hypothetical protein